MAIFPHRENYVKCPLCGWYKASEDQCYKFDKAGLLATLRLRITFCPFYTDATFVEQEKLLKPRKERKHTHKFVIVGRDDKGLPLVTCSRCINPQIERFNKLYGDKL